MNSNGQIILASSTNPFDKSYSNVQETFDKMIIKLIFSSLNLNLSFVSTPLITNLQNYESNPDNWIFEQIVNGSAEISSTTLILTRDTPNICDFTYGIGIFRPQLYYRVKSLKEQNNIYRAPFSYEGWLSVGIAFLILGGVLTFIMSQEAKLPYEISYDAFTRLFYEQENRDVVNEKLPKALEESIERRKRWDAGEILLICFGCMCQQGSVWDPGTNAARIVLSLQFLIAVVLYTAYAASIISIVSLFPSIDQEHYLSNETLLKQDALLHDTQKIARDLLLYNANIQRTNLKKGFTKVLKGEAIFVGDKDVSLTFLHNKNYGPDIKCKIGKASLGIEYHRVFALRKNSSYKSKINNILLRLKESGLLVRERRKIFKTKPLCIVSEKSSLSNYFSSFGGHETWPLLALLGSGITVSLLILSLEKLFKHFYKK